jgi:WD40 repeat protein
MRAILTLILPTLVVSALAAPVVLRGAPTGLDRLDPGAIPRQERFDGQPPELVAVLGRRGSRLGSVPGCPVYSPDGKILATGGDANDPAISLWDATTLRRQAVLPGHEGVIYQLAFSADGKTLASCDYSKRLRVWDLSGLRPRPRADVSVALGERLWHVAFGPDAPLLAVSDGSAIVRVWDMSRSPPMETAALHNPAAADREPGGVNWVAFAGSRKALGTLDYYNTLRLWDLSRPRPRIAWAHPLGPERNPVLGFAPDGKLLAVASGFSLNVLGPNPDPGTKFPSPGVVKLWRVGKGGPKAWATLPAGQMQHVDYVGQLGFTPDGRTLVFACFTGTYYVYDLDGPRPRLRHTLTDFALVGEEPDAPQPAFALSPDGRRLVTVNRPDQVLRVWDLSRNPPRPVLPEGPVDPWFYAAVQFAPDGKTLATWRYRLAADGHAPSGKGEVELWDLVGPTPTRRTSFALDDKTLFGMSFSPDGRTLATCRSLEGNVIRLWDAAEAVPCYRARLTMPGENLFLQRFSPAGGVLAAAGSHIIYLWDVRGPEPKKWATVDAGEANGIQSLAYSWDGKVLAHGSGAGELSTWRLDGAAPRAVATTQTGLDFSPPYPAFSHDGRSLACLGLPSTRSAIVVWFYDQAGGRLKLRRKAECERKTAWWAGASDRIAFTPDDRRLLLQVDNEVLVLDAASGNALFRQQLPGSVVDADFAPDGRHVAVADGDGTVYILRLPSREGPPRDP